jgi:transcriptional regulator NrdR family protein
MNCPKCQHADSKTTDSRDTNAGAMRRRRHRCLGCDYRWSTKELPVELVDAMVDLIATHLAIEEAYATTFGRSKPIITKLFEK